MNCPYCNKKIVVNCCYSCKIWFDLNRIFFEFSDDGDELIIVTDENVSLKNNIVYYTATQLCDIQVNGIYMATYYAINTITNQEKEELEEKYKFLKSFQNNTPKEWMTNVLNDPKKAITDLFDNAVKTTLRITDEEFDDLIDKFPNEVWDSILTHRALISFSEKFE